MGGSRALVGCAVRTIPPRPGPRSGPYEDDCLKHDDRHRPGPGQGPLQRGCLAMIFCQALNFCLANISWSSSIAGCRTRS
jgi:hypothetical protein